MKRKVRGGGGRSARVQQRLQPQNMYKSACPSRPLNDYVPTRSFACPWLLQCEGLGELAALSKPIADLLGNESVIQFARSSRPHHRLAPLALLSPVEGTPLSRIAQLLCATR